LHSLGKMQDALAALDRTLQQEPSFYLALLAKGEILRELQQYPTAIAAYNQIIHEQNPLEPDVYSFFQSKAFYWRAATQYALRNTQSAIADYGEAIRLNPYFARAYYQRGSVYLELKNKPAAIQDFEQAANSYKAQGNMAGYHNTQQILSFLK
jgi:tetratricopeptide (TPR) repeat protein